MEHKHITSEELLNQKSLELLENVFEGLKHIKDFTKDRHMLPIKSNRKPYTLGELYRFKMSLDAIYSNVFCKMNTFISHPEIDLEDTCTIANWLVKKYNANNVVELLYSYTERFHIYTMIMEIINNVDYKTHNTIISIFAPRSKDGVLDNLIEKLNDLTCEIKKNVPDWEYIWEVSKRGNKEE